MTIPELKALADRTLQFALDQIRASGDLAQQFTLVKRSGGIDLMVVDGRISNDENAKRSLARMIRERAESGEIEAVIMAADSWIAEEMTPENEKIKDRLRLTVVEAADLGLCGKAECIVVMLESPILQQLITQKYKRDGGKIILLGEPVSEDDSSGKFRAAGRFAGYWPQEKKAPV